MAGESVKITEMAKRYWWEHQNIESRNSNVCGDNFLREVHDHSTDGTGNEYREQYLTCLKKLEEGYSRHTFLELLAEESERLDESTKNLLNSSGQFSNLCNIMHY
jgi:hypothetical protein